MTKKNLIYLAAFIVFGCIKVKNNNDKNGIETVNQVQTTKNGVNYFSINFNIEAKEELRLEGEVLCSDFMPLQKVSWDLSESQVLIGKGISLAYENPGTKSVTVKCIGNGGNLEKKLTIDVNESDSGNSDCVKCADRVGRECKTSETEIEGEIWRKDESSCWKSHAGFVDLAEDLSQGESGQIVPNGISTSASSLTMPISNNDDPNQGGTNPNPIDGEPTCETTYGQNLVLNNSFEDTSKFKTLEDKDKDILFGSKSWNIYTSEEINHWNVRWTNKSEKKSISAGLENGVCGEAKRKGMLELQTFQTLKIRVPDGQIYAELDSDCGGPNGPKVFRGQEHTNVRIFQKIKNLTPNDEYLVAFDFRRRRPTGDQNNKIVFKFSGVKYVIDLVSYDELFLENDELNSRLFSYDGRSYELRRKDDQWYQFITIIKPWGSKATLSIKDQGDPDSFGVLVDDFIIQQMTKTCRCIDGSVVDENASCN